MNFLKRILFSSYTHIGTSLVHWTGRKKAPDEAYTIIDKICESQQLRMSFCPKYVEGAFTPQTSMVCFTDIPLYLSQRHCSLFGKFGIGFNKNRLIDYGANPVLYTTRRHFDRIRSIFGIQDIMLEAERDREWQKQFSSIAAFSEEQTWALYEILGYLQEYSYHDRDHDQYVTYHQREWRLSFDCLELQTSGLSNEVGKKSFAIENGASHRVFNFDKADIDFIVVPKSHKKEAKPLANKLGCKLKIYESEVI